MATRKAQKGNSQQLFQGGGGTLSGGMQVMSEEEMQFAKQQAQQNTDLVSGQHQVVRMSGQRHTTTTIFEN